MTIFLSGRQHTGALCVYSPTAAAPPTYTAFKRKMWFEFSRVAR